MKLSELIEIAKEAMAEHGDIPVIADDTGCGCCSRGSEFAETRIATGVWVYDYSDEHGEVPTAFKVWA